MDSHLNPSFEHTPRVRRDLPSEGENVPLVEVKPENKPPLAGPEIDDSDEDNRQVVTHPYSGVDDGLFPPDTNTVHDDGTDTSDFPIFTDRAGEGDGEEKTVDDADGAKKPASGNGAPLPGRTFGRFPPYGTDLEVGSMFPGDLDSIPDVNVYQHKKTLAQGMMDLALFSANANQLRYVLESSSRHPYYYPSIVFISISLIFQVAVGIGLIWNATYNVKDEKEICVANKINNFTVIGIFLVTVINVFISAFGVASPATTP